MLDSQFKDFWFETNKSKIKEKQTQSIAFSDI